MTASKQNLSRNNFHKSTRILSSFRKISFSHSLVLMLFHLLFAVSSEFSVITVNFIYLFYLLLFIHYLQLGRHPVARVVTYYISTDYEDFTLKFR